MDIKKILENGALNEETQNNIMNAWTAKLDEIKNELREEYAQKYKHDIGLIVEAADKMFNDTLEKELQANRKVRQELSEQKVRYKDMIKEHAVAIQKFTTEQLHKEIKELREENINRNKVLENFSKFAVLKLRKEITELHEDRKEFVNQKVRLVEKAKEKIEEAKKRLIERSANKISTVVSNVLVNEMVNFRKDIKKYRQNSFGQRVFEAFAAEFMASQYSDGTEAKKLMSAIKEREEKLNEAMALVKNQKVKLDETSNALNALKNRTTREKKLTEMLAPLSKEKQEVMKDLLESVDTSNLEQAYKKHIKFVLNENVKPAQKAVLTEVNGNKTQSKIENNDQQNVDQVSMLRRLAGIQK